MTKKPKIIDVTAAIIWKEDKILIAKRAKGEHLEGLWEFPGGKIDKDETAEQCLQRELFEEFGIETKIGKFVCENFHDYENKQIRLIAFNVLHKSGDFTLNVHDEIKWVLPIDINNYNFAPADIPIVNKLIAENP